MKKHPKLKNIETGYTQRGVNQAVIRYLLEKGISPNKVLDIPCGQGHFLRALKSFFPDTQVYGQDLFMQPLPEIKEHFVQKDIKDWSSYQNIKFDLITSISGVMVHDDLVGFIEKSHAHLIDKGHLIITNDNILTLRDRLSFLFLGRFRRFKKIYDLNEGNWNLVKVQSIYMLLRRKNFTIEHIQYTSIYPEDYLFLPLVILLFPIHLLNLFFTKSDLSFQEKYQKFPLAAFFARHYFIVAKRHQ
jgi:SAM-dependent methyltransferase